MLIDDANIELPVVAASSVATPPAGKLVLFFNSTNGNLSQKNSSGIVTDLTSTSAGGESNTKVTIDVGTSWRQSFDVVITNALCLTSSVIEIAVYVDPSASADVIANNSQAALSWRMFCVAGNGSFTLSVLSTLGLCKGTFTVIYSIS